MNKYIWLNAVYLVFFILRLMVFSMNKSGGPFIGGALVLLVLMGAGIIACYFLCICIMFFTKWIVFTKVVTVISSFVFVAIALASIRSSMKEQQMQEKWQQEREKAWRKENSPEGIKHKELVRAIYANDSLTVKQLVQSGVKPTDEDLSGAIQQVFESDNEISAEIFKALISNGANARNCPSSFLNNRFCKNFEIVKLLLEASGPTQEWKSFPLVCLPQLKLILQHVQIDWPSRIYYFPNKQAAIGSSLGREGNWTPIMIYLLAYPRYFEETQFLLTQNPDLKYKDEHGYSLQQLLNDIVIERKIKGESVEELIEFGKKIQ